MSSKKCQSAAILFLVVVLVAIPVGTANALTNPSSSTPQRPIAQSSKSPAHCSRLKGASAGLLCVQWGPTRHPSEPSSAVGLRPARRLLS